MDYNNILLIVNFILLVVLVIVIIVNAFKCSEGFGNGYYHKGKMVNKNDNLLWLQELTTGGPIVKYMNKLSKKYNKDFVILSNDYNIDEFWKNDEFNDSLKFVSSIHKDKIDNNYIYPIPQYDFYFNGVKEFKTIPFKDKKNEIIWRGQTGTPLRKKLIKQLENIKNIPLNIKSVSKISNDWMSKEDQMEYKYILAIDGTGWPGNISWVLASGSVPIIASRWSVWFMPLLVPWEDYVPIEVDKNEQFPDLEKNIKKILSNNELGARIASNSVKKYRWIMSKQKEYLDNIFKYKKSYLENLKML